MGNDADSIDYFAGVMEALADDWEPVEDMHDMAGRLAFLTRIADALMNGPLPARDRRNWHGVRVVVIAVPDQPLPTGELAVPLQGVPTGRGDATSCMVHNGFQPEALASLLGELAFAVSAALQSQGHGQHGQA